MQAFKEMKQYKFGADFLHPEFKAFVFDYPAMMANAAATAITGTPAASKQWPRVRQAMSTRQQSKVRYPSFRGSVQTQRYHRIDPRRAQGGHHARQQRHERQHHRTPDVGRRIPDRHAIDQR